MDDVVFHELSRQSNGDRSFTHSLTCSLTNSLTHSILINLFIKVELNIFSPTSPAKYFVQQNGGTHHGGRRWFFVRSVYRNSFVGWKSQSCYRKEQTLAATNRRNNPESPGKHDGNGKSYDVYRQHSGGGMKSMPCHLKAKVSLFPFCKKICYKSTFEY